MGAKVDCSKAITSLSLLQDEMVTVIRRIDNNWAEGKLGERIGIFPISFVEVGSDANECLTFHWRPLTTSSTQNITSRILCIELIDNSVKKFSYNERPLTTSGFFFASFYSL